MRSSQSEYPRYRAIGLSKVLVYKYDGRGSAIELEAPGSTIGYHGILQHTCGYFLTRSVLLLLLLRVSWYNLSLCVAWIYLIGEPCVYGALDFGIAVSPTYTINVYLFLPRGAAMFPHARLICLVGIVFDGPDHWTHDPAVNVSHSVELLFYWNGLRKFELCTVKHNI